MVHSLNSHFAASQVKSPVGFISHFLIFIIVILVLGDLQLAL